MSNEYYDISTIEWSFLRDDKEKTSFAFNEFFNYLKELKSLVKSSRSKAQTLLTVLFPIVLGVSGFLIKDNFFKNITQLNFFLICEVGLLYVSICLLVFYSIKSYYASGLNIDPDKFFQDGFYKDNLTEIQLSLLFELIENIKFIKQILFNTAKKTDNIFILVVLSPLISFILSILTMIVFYFVQ